MELTEFLRARLDEDEREARACLDQYARGDGGSRRRWDRQLAQVAAMRAIVDLHPEMLGFCQGCASERFPCRTLQRLAAFWPSHPDYDPAWSPEGE